MFGRIFAFRPLSEVTGMLFIAHGVMSVFFAAVLGPSAVLSWTGILLLVSLDVCLWLSLKHAASRTLPILLTTAWFIFLFFLPRLSAFQIFPAENISFVAIRPFTREEVTKGLAYILAGYLTIWAGLSVAVALLPNWSHRIPARLPFAGIAAYAGLAFAAAIYVIFFLQVSVYSANPEQWGSRMGWVAILFNQDVAFLAAVTWLVAGRCESRFSRAAAIAIIVICLLLSLVTGSRGGGLRVMILFGLAVFAIYGNPITTVQRVLAIVCLSFIASAIMYPLGTYIRFVPASGENAFGALEDYWFRIGPLEENADAAATRLAWSGSPLVKSVVASASPVVTRLGLVDYPIQIVSREPDPAVIDKYLAVSYSLKNFINNLVPGEIFPDHDIMTSRVFNMAYRGYGEEHVRRYFLSEPWTLWGYSWLKGHGAVGGLAVILGLAFIMQAGYMLLCRFGGVAAPYAAVTYLFLPLVGGFLQLFGLDHWLTITAHFALALMLMVAFVNAVEAARSRLFRRKELNRM